MKKRLFIVLFIVLFFIVTVVILFQLNIISFDTFAGNKIITEASSVETLSNGYFYIWHNPNNKDISSDLNDPGEEPVFFLCPEGDKNWDKNSFFDHILWFSSDNDYTIPTLYPGDKLLYISDSSVPYKGISWERFCDYGYTIGIGNLIGDESGHYRIESSDGSSFKGYVYNDSDCVELNQFSGYGDLFLDKVGGVSLRKNSISAGGTVINLDKDDLYLCEFYTGTFFQDFELTANIHSFCAFESYTTYDFDFLHSNVIEIKIPEWFKSGYYHINNLGFFRFLSSSDTNIYSGEPYDNNINWNDPIILYDEYNKIIYDPSQNIDLRSSYVVSTETGDYINPNDDPNSGDPGFVNNLTDQRVDSSVLR